MNGSANAIAHGPRAPGAHAASLPDTGGGRVMRMRPFRLAYCEHCAWKGKLYNRSPMGEASGPCPQCQAWGRLYWSLEEE